MKNHDHAQVVHPPDQFHELENGLDLRHRAQSENLPTTDGGNPDREVEIGREVESADDHLLDVCDLNHHRHHPDADHQVLLDGGGRELGQEVHQEGRGVELGLQGEKTHGEDREVDQIIEIVEVLVFHRHGIVAM